MVSGALPVILPALLDFPGVLAAMPVSECFMAAGALIFIREKTSDSQKY